MGTRRMRGALLRLAFRRQLALASGAGCVGVAVWLAAVDYTWESAVSDGLGMIVGATGVALVLMAIGGRQPDWEE